ncbi:hypothetical protein MAFF212519_26800 [Clavibacter michiganensis]
MAMLATSTFTVAAERVDPSTVMDPVTSSVLPTTVTSVPLSTSATRYPAVLPVPICHSPDRSLVSSVESAGAAETDGAAAGAPTITSR